MHKKHVKLLKYLLSQNSIKTSNTIASVLGISIKSVKNYIKEINAEQNTKVILSSKQGYYINKEIALTILSKNNNTIPQNYEERAYYLIKLLLLKHIDEIDIYELCDTLFIGYSTLKADIVNMNKTFPNFGIKFTCERDYLKISGSEKSKRKLVSHVIYEEVSGNFLDMNYLVDNFNNLDIYKIKEIIETTFKKHSYYLNDLNLFNLVLHFTIIINRIKEGNYINTNNDYLIENLNDRSIIKDLTLKLETEFNISIDNKEQYDIYLLFKNNTNAISPNSLKELKKLVSSDIIDFSKSLILKINEDYYINLLNDSFIIPFSLHLKNLFLRCKNNSFIKNPMLDIIKTNSPMVYEIGIFASLQIQKTFQITIPEDEIAYISLHIGAELERQKINESKISCVLLCPNYIQMDDTLYNKLLFEFGNYINIIDTITDIRALEHLDLSLLITTLKVKNNLNYEIVQVSPFLSPFDKRSILDIIEIIKNKNMNLILKNNFHHFFNKDTFFINTKMSKKEDAIILMANRLIKLDYVHNDFYNKVMEREAAASTAFSNIAIPHSVEMNAIKTSISVLISKEGIPWDDKIINLILMLSINRADKKVFYQLYQALITLFSDPAIMKLIKEVLSFEDFKSLIYSSIS